VRRVVTALIAVSALFALLSVSGASAASNSKCKSPTGTRAPVTHLRAGYATSCAAAKKVAKGWDSQCQPFDDLCFVSAAGNKWSCRATNYEQQPRYRSQIFLKCALKETTAGRPSVNFRETGAVHHCADPQGTRHQIYRLIGYYAACGRALAVATAWDSACDTGEDGSTCTADAAGKRWTCKQAGRPGVDSGYRYYCDAPGEPARVVFVVTVTPFPPGP
jgi:hypothetical protein